MSSKYSSNILRELSNTQLTRAGVQSLKGLSFDFFWGADESINRTMVFMALIAANIFLTLVNCSFYYSIFTTIKYRNNLVLLIICIIMAILGFIGKISLSIRFNEAIEELFYFRKIL